MLWPSPLVLALVLAVWVTITASASSGSILELNKGNLTVAMHHWKYDLAVMFYAPWCPNCK
jgi:thiol-disulfide isomerase/thioredoxin